MTRVVYGLRSSNEAGARASGPMHQTASIPMKHLERVLRRVLLLTAAATLVAGCQPSSDEAAPGQAEEGSAASDDGAAEADPDEAPPAEEAPAPVVEEPAAAAEADGIWGAWDPADDLAALQGTWNGPDGATWTFEGTSGTVTRGEEATAVEIELRSPVALTIRDPAAGSAVTHSFTRNDEQMWAGLGRSARRIGDRVVVYEGRYTLVCAEGTCTAYQHRFGEWSEADAVFVSEDDGETFRYGAVNDGETRWGNTITFDGSAGVDVQLARSVVTAVQ